MITGLMVDNATANSILNIDIGRITFNPWGKSEVQQRTGRIMK
jgi:hypothetical protein